MDGEIKTIKCVCGKEYQIRLGKIIAITCPACKTKIPLK